MKKYLAALLALPLASFTAFGQQPTPLEEKLDETVTGKPATEETSDVGAQTPVDVGGAISSYGGLDLRYLYRDNALSVSEPLGSALKSGIIQHTFYAGAVLPSRTLADGVLTPFIGASRTDVYHDNNIDNFDFDNAAESAYLLWQYQLTNGLVVRGGLEYGRSLNTEDDTEDYRDYHPNVSVMKYFPLENGHGLLATVKTGIHQTKVPSGLLNNTSSRFDNWETSGTLQYVFTPFEKVTARPFANVSYKSYDEGSNDGREDVTTSFGVSASYDLRSWLQIVGSAVHVDRDSSGISTAGSLLSYNPNTANEFENFDVGLGINVTHSF